MLSPLLLPALQTLVISTNAFPFSLFTRDTAQQTGSTFANAFDSSKQVLYNAQTGPQMLDIAQGNNGDCWLDATLASLAYADPNGLKATMNDPHNSDGTVTITLFDGSTSQGYTVTKKNIDTISQSNSDASASTTGGNYVWPAAMEDAFTAYANAHQDTGMSLTLTGGQPQKAYAALYGSGASLAYFQTSNTDDDKLWSIWNEAFTHPAVSTSQEGDGTFIGGGLWLPANHAYTLVRCDQTIQVVTLRNPWGFVSENGVGGQTSGGAGVTDRGNGLFDISYADWKTYFVDITQVTPIAVPSTSAPVVSAAGAVAGAAAAEAATGAAAGASGGGS